MQLFIPLRPPSKQSHHHGSCLAFAKHQQANAKLDCVQIILLRNYKTYENLLPTLPRNFVLELTLCQKVAWVSTWSRHPLKCKKSLSGLYASCKFNPPIQMWFPFTVLFVWTQISLAWQIWPPRKHLVRLRFSCCNHVPASQYQGQAFHKSPAQVRYQLQLFEMQGRHSCYWPALHFLLPLASPSRPLDSPKTKPSWVFLSTVISVCEFLDLMSMWICQDSFLHTCCCSSN